MIICKVEQGAEALRCIRMIEGENPITVSLICINAGLTGEHMQELFKKSHGKMVYVSQNGVRCAHSLRLITSLRTSGNYIVKENQFRT